MRVSLCQECGRTFPSVGEQPWCPYCGSQKIEVHEPDKDHELGDRQTLENEGGGWIRIIVVVVLILMFFAIYAGGGLDGIASWYREITR